MYYNPWSSKVILFFLGYLKKKPKSLKKNTFEKYYLSHSCGI